MLKNFRNKLLVATALVAGAATTAGSALAAAPDTTDVVASIAAAGVAGALIGVAVLSMHYGIKLFKWIKGAG